MSVRDWNNLNGVGNDFPNDAVNCLYNSPLIKICQAFIFGDCSQRNCCIHRA
ncbi:hypothetical protein HMPREF3197_00603 [Klebsiella pneumoniae]|nr:hypothetical protein HMPREF3197_00603 [Klebsiella pneumoniae]